MTVSAASGPTSLADDARLAGDLVQAAGRMALEMRAGGIATSTKTSVSDVVTAADHAAEELIRERLATERPDDGVLGEEGTSVEGRSGRRWVIDPVDGTYNFAAGLDWWCSAIALTDGDDVLLGAIHHPATDTLYVGGPDLPSTSNGEPMSRLVDRDLASSCLTTYLHPPYFGTEVADTFAQVVSGVATLRMLGSGSMDATAIARGSLHVSCQHSVPDWDRLPGAGIIRGVGGVVRRTTAAGVEWTTAGVPTAVGEVIDRLSGR